MRYGKKSCAGLFIFFLSLRFFLIFRVSESARIAKKEDEMALEEERRHEEEKRRKRKEKGDRRY